MNKEIFTYLRSYSVDPQKVNSLIVSAFLYSYNLEKTGNKFLRPFIIDLDDEEYDNLQEFIAIHQFSKIEELIEVFEFVISPEEKVVTGAVYTPKHIREYIIEQSFSGINDFEAIKICDPACGCSGFLYTAAEFIKNRTDLSYYEIFQKNIFGLDIQEFSITRSKLLLTLFALSKGEEENFEFNLFQGNALNFIWGNMLQGYKGFDVIVGNPPYVCSRNIEEESKQYIFDWKVSSSGHPDLYIPFFQIGVENLKEDGILGYITMNTFFKSVNGRTLRQYFEDEALSLKILDFGSNQVFQSKSTYTCICIIQKKKSESVEYAKGDDSSLSNGIAFKSIPYIKLNHKNGWNLQSIDLLNKIENTGTPFGEMFKTRNGIATLKNKVYILDPIRQDSQFYYILHKDREYPIEKNCCVDVVNPNKLINLSSIENIRKKIIFPYVVDNNLVGILKEDQFLSEYPNAYNYLKSQKKELAQRDKGKGAKYENWYQYGRNQSLEPFSYKLFFPHISQRIPNYVINSEPDLLFVNGLAIVSDNLRDLQYLRKIMSSRVFWFYIVNSSKPYGSGYYSFSRNYIKNFGIFDFSNDQIDYLINTDCQSEIDLFIEKLYNIDLSDFNSSEYKLRMELV